MPPWELLLSWRQLEIDNLSLRCVKVTFLSFFNHFMVQHKSNFSVIMKCFLSLYTLTALILPVVISGKMELPPGVTESKI